MAKTPPKGNARPRPTLPFGAGKGGGGQPMAPLPTAGGPPIPVKGGKPGKGKPF